MAEKMSGMFDGEQHWLEPGVYFSEEGCYGTIVDWEELEEEDELSPFEAPSVEPVVRSAPPLFQTPKYLTQFPHSKLEQAWGTLSVALSVFADICEFDKDQYEHLTTNGFGGPSETNWSFMTREPITERM